MKGAVFDWDGTLAHIDEREFYCINMALKEQGVDPIDKNFFVKNYYLRAYEVGTGPRMVLEAALPGKAPTLLEAVYESYRRAFQRTVDKATLQAGALEILRALKRQGFRVGIATMRFTRWVVESELKHLRVAPLTDVLLTREDLGFGRTLESLEETVDKRTQLVSRALGKLGIGSEDAFLVGDSWWDVRAGKRLGMKTVLVKTGFSFYNDFSSEEPDLTVASLVELVGLLERGHWTIWDPAPLGGG